MTAAKTAACGTVSGGVGQRVLANKPIEVRKVRNYEE
jgi:hypothetical protein